MTRTEEEKKYWDKAALDPDVDIKYISDLPIVAGLNAVGKMEGVVLEIGCGVGRLMKPNYYGIDISEKMLEIAKERHPKYNFRITDGRSIPFRNKFFDSVYSVLLFQHLPLGAIIGYIFEAFRVLKSGGTFRFQFIEGTEDEPFSKHHNAKKLVDTLEVAGFTVEPMDQRLGHISWSWLTGRKL